MKQKILSMLMALLITFSPMANINALGINYSSYGYDETPATSVKVFVTVSSDGVPVLGANDEVLAHMEVEVPYFDLDLYNMFPFYRYETNGGKGPYINETLVKRPTAMHLFIYITERFYMGLPEEECCLGTSGIKEYYYETEVRWFDDYDTAYSSEDYNGSGAYKCTGAATSTYLTNFWGHDQNFMYFRNHRFPLMSEGWGATSDYMLLSDGDVIEIGLFTNWGFYHKGAFLSFDKEEYTADEDGNITFTVKATSTTGKQGQITRPEEGKEVEETPIETYTGDIDLWLYDEEWTLIEDAEFEMADEAGTYTVTIPENEPGKYYLIGTDFYAKSDDSNQAPATAIVNVPSGDGSEEPSEEPVSVTRVLLNSYNLSLSEGKNFKLEATVVPNAVSDTEVTWESSNEDVATVDQNGRVTTISAGTTEIIATAGGKTSEKCVVTVREINKAPVVSNSIRNIKIDREKAYSFELGDMFSDPDGNALTYTVNVGTKSGQNQDGNFEYTYLEEAKDCSGEYDFISKKTGVYNIKFTASDGKKTAENNVMVTVVDNDSGKIDLGEFVTADIEGVVSVFSSSALGEIETESGKISAEIIDVVLKHDTVGTKVLFEFDITDEEKTTVYIDEDETGLLEYEADAIGSDTVFYVKNNDTKETKAYCFRFEIGEEPVIKYGDVNGDSKVNILDANTIRRYLANIVSFSEEEYLAGDVDKNGEINVIDASIIRRYTVKIIKKLPIEEEV